MKVIKIGNIVKDNNKSLKKIACILLCISLFTACGPSDTSAPVISMAELVSKIVTVSASDDVGVTSYLLTTDSTLPSKDDAKWSSTAEFSLTDYGTYYVWAKDEAGNISMSVEVVYESTLERLAKDYDHLAWIIAPDTAETKALKEQYGDLYPMVEPLTEQQIRERFEYLVDYLVKEKNITGDTYAGGLSQTLSSDSFYNEVVKFRDDYRKEIINTKDPVLSKYSERYYYSEQISIYASRRPKSLTSRETRFGVGLDIIETATFEDMEWFVRNYMMEAYKTVNMAIESNAEMYFYFDPLNQD